jgi:hypothetical protein
MTYNFVSEYIPISIYWPVMPNARMNSIWTNKFEHNQRVCVISGKHKGLVGSIRVCFERNPGWLSNYGYELKVGNKFLYYKFYECELADITYLRKQKLNEL